ncbi:MAG TPA: hypothetical protein VK277_12390 [Acidimicrobiales bacterium]|nr:hypothetical protein [Acidimicrobiales bacterium]
MSAMQGTEHEEAPTWRSAVERRLDATEAALVELGEGLTTRRLAIRDDEGLERIVADVDGDTAELRVGFGEAPERSAVVLFATTETAARRAELGEGLGVQLWARGSLLVELCLWSDADGRCRPSVHLYPDR